MQVTADSKSGFQSTVDEERERSSSGRQSSRPGEALIHIISEARARGSH